MEGSDQQQNNNKNMKVERKVMEKNRRNQMKLLYSNLNSLLPHHSNELPPLSSPTVSDQIEEAIRYIKFLETKLKNDEEKKESLLRIKSKTSSLPSYTTKTKSHNNNNSPELIIKEFGSAVEVVLTTGLEDQFLFYDIIHIFHEERVEIINATYSVRENTVLYSLHAEIEDVMYEFGATKVMERVKGLIYKSKNNDAEMQAAAASSSGHGGTHPPTNTPKTSSGGH